MRSQFRPDAQTRVVAVHAFKKGDDLNLTGKPSGSVAPEDTCMVKLVVGPGNAGPADAPSTSEGIGMEVWLPSAWNGRVRVDGGGGWAGTRSILSTTAITRARPGTRAPADASMDEGWVTAVTDGGHSGSLGGSFAMNPDGSINKASWLDFASRAVHETAVKTKALAAAYYGRSAHHAYFVGCSTGGRQGLNAAQEHPEDFDGIVAGAPAINWTRFITGELYPQVVMQRDLGGVPMTLAQLNLASSAAISSCDTALNGEHDGYLSDPAMCRYDPTRDQKVLCTSDGGQNTSDACLTRPQALAVNKMWYGQTVDGSVPDPAVDNGMEPPLGSKQLWFGLSRGTNFAALAASANGVGRPFFIGTTMVALEMQKPAIAGSDFQNATGNGADGWTMLSYADLAHAADLGVKLQPAFAHINTDKTDLSRFLKRGGKIIHYHGLSDQLIPSPGSDKYYSEVAKRAGGYAKLQTNYRYYAVPALGHCGGVGSVNGLADQSPPANPPLPETNQLLNAMIAWVEQGKAPDSLVIHSPDGMISRPLCAFPKALKYIEGDRKSAASYACQ